MSTALLARSALLGSDSTRLVPFVLATGVVDGLGLAGGLGRSPTPGELVRAGRNPEELARELEPSAPSIRNWVQQADLTNRTSAR